MSKTPATVKVPTPLLQAILNYLALHPYKDVAHLVIALQQAAQPTPEQPLRK